MKNNVELLRAICFTSEDMKDITNLADSFTEKEIEFMVEFKKIYELGLTQLKKFVEKLDEEGKDLDTYTIQYYVDILNNGPLGAYVQEYTELLKYFTKTPDIMGHVGNKNYSPANVTIYSTDNYPLGCAVDTYNKLPKFIQDTLKNAIEQTEDVFRTSLKSSTEVDNTLPIVDKSPQKRHDEEPVGKWVLRANGNYMVKDSYYYKVIDKISQAIFDSVKMSIGEEDFRMYKDKKQYDPFDSEKNESTATNNKIKKNIVSGDKTQEVTLDILGDVFDSEERRGSVLTISSDTQDTDYKLNTVKGQLGS